MRRWLSRHINRARQAEPSASKREERILTCERDEYVFHYPSKSMVGHYLAIRGGWDTVLGPILRALFPEDDVLVAEVGSNIGASLLQIKLAKPSAKVVCFEPSERFLPILRKNIAANEWTDVTIAKLLLASAAGERKLFTNATTASVVSAEYDNHDFLYAEEVETSTLDSYFSSSDRLDFLKVDTDGFDYDVLRGGSDVLSRLKPTLYFEFDKQLLERAGRDPAAFLAFLATLGYKDFLALSNYGEALSIASTPKQVMDLTEGTLYLDILGIHCDRPDQSAALPELVTEIGSKHVLEPLDPATLPD